MSKATAFFSALAGCHLVLVACAAAGIGLFGNSFPVGQALRTYGAYSGSDSRYGFFAPNVGPNVRATFTLADDQGRTWTDTLESGANREVQLRIGGLTALFFSAEDRDALAASWAGKMLGRQPDAVLVTVSVETYGSTGCCEACRSWQGPGDPTPAPEGCVIANRDQLYHLPSMARYRAGDRPMWRTIYQQTFTRDGDTSAEKGVVP